jgi:uncharacterized protein
MSHILVLAQQLAVCRLTPVDEFPSWLHRNGFLAVTYTSEELSIVCDEHCVPDNVQTEKGWRILKVQGPLDFSQVGVLAAIAVPLARAGVSIFAISTFDTDYILVKEASLPLAMDVLQQDGHFVEVA